MCKANRVPSRLQCGDNPCAYHRQYSSWVGPTTSRFPRPQCDEERSRLLGKPIFRAWSDTEVDGRTCDDNYPTALLRCEFEKGLRSKDLAAVVKVAFTICADLSLVHDKLRRWEEALEIHNIRARTRLSIKVLRRMFLCLKSLLTSPGMM
jgi:hypothetical protein